jgi:hypothetical protein
VNLPGPGDGPTPTLAPAVVVAGIADWARRIELASDAGRAARGLLALLAGSVGATRGSILVRDAESGALRLLAGMGLPPLPAGAPLPGRRHISDHVMRECKAILIHGEVRDARFEASAAADHLASAMCVPILGRRGPMGVLSLSRIEPAPRFTAEEMASVELTGAAMGAILERMLDLAAARAGWRRLTARDPVADWPRAVSGDVALSLVEGTSDAPDRCEHVAHGDGSITILLAEPFGPAAIAIPLADRLCGAFLALAPDGASMSALAEGLNAVVREHSPGRASRAWLGKLTPRGEMRSCAAGYPPPFWLPFEGHRWQRWPEGGPPLGTARYAGEYAETSLRMMPGDLCVVLSDAVLAAASGHHVWTEELVAEELLQHRREPVEEQVRRATSVALERSGHAVPADDLLALALRHTRRA